MVEIVVAVIGMLATIGAAVLPTLLDRRKTPASADFPSTVRPASLTFVFIVAFFVLLGVWSSAATISDSYAVSLGKLSFFLGISGIASALFGRCAFSHRQIFGTYVGYLSATVAALFLLWSLLNGAPGEIVSIYAMVTTVAIAKALLLFWVARHSSGSAPPETPPRS